MILHKYLHNNNTVAAIEFILDETNNHIQRANTLRRLFSWTSTPQGYDFWSLEEDNLNKGNDISHEAMMYLTVLLEYEKTHAPV